MSNSNTLNCRISRRSEGFEGTVTIPGLRPTKLVRTSDNSPLYSTRAGVTQSAQALAKRFGMTLSVDDRTDVKGKKAYSSSVVVG